MDRPLNERGDEESVGREPLGVAPAQDLTKQGPIWLVVDVLMLVGVSVMLLSVGLQVVTRLAGASVPWTEELTRFVFIDVTFLGMAAGFRVAAHPRVTFLVAVGPAWLKRASVHLYAVTGVAFFAILAWNAWLMMSQQFASGESSPALGLQMFLITLPVVVSAALALLAHIQSLYFSPEMRKSIEQGDMVA